MLGSHLSIAGAMVNALIEAERLRLDTVQVFTKNQQQWKAKPLDPGAVEDWLRELKRLGWTDRTVSHASYLINLASPNDTLHAGSIDLMTEEVERCERLSIPFLVHHPGSFTTSTLEAGVRRIADAYKEVLRRTAGYRTVICLEGTTGGGSLIGGPFEHLADTRAAIIDRTSLPDRVGFCLDTCHLHAFGHDMSSRESAREVFARFDAICGIRHLRVWHVNDSKGERASRLDRHAHIGEGTIGRRRVGASGFAELMNDPRFGSVPKILETPKGVDDAGRNFDTLNIARLRKLAGASRPPVKVRTKTGKAR